MFEVLRTPQYIFRPSQLIRRTLRVVRGTKPLETVMLPWGLEIVVDTADCVGRAIALQGVYDLVTTELLWRLTASGDKVIDCGAHVGYMTSVLARRAGYRGSVLAFEPHPESVQRLNNNVQKWTAVAPITIQNIALSNFRGQATLLDVPTHPQNKCWFHLPGGNHQHEKDRPCIAVAVHRLDEYISSEIGVMKLDVEYHEAQVLEGAGEHLRNVRDIVFEEVGPYPQQSHHFLERAGYSIIWFEERFAGPRMIDAGSRPNCRHYHTLPSYLATRDYKRAERLLSISGWRCLQRAESLLLRHDW